MVQKLKQSRESALHVGDANGKDRCDHRAIAGRAKRLGSGMRGIGEDAGDTEVGCIGEIQGMQVHARIAQHAACRSEATLVVLQENSQLRNH